MDKNVFFVVLIVILGIFLIQKYTRLITISILCIIFYMLFKSNFTNPQDFIYWIANIYNNIYNNTSRSINSYSSNSNSSNSNNSSNSSNSISNSNSNSNNIIENIKSYINPNSNSNIKLDDSNLNNYYLSKSMIISIQNSDITINNIILKIPLLLEYKLYSDDVIQFIINYVSNASNAGNSIPSITYNDIAYAIKSKMVKIFKMAYITITDNTYASHSYNELLYAETEFNDALNMIDFLTLSRNTTNTTNTTKTIGIFKTRITDLNNKLNQYIIDKVNDIAITHSYNITTSILPQLNEPIGFVI